MLLTNQLIGFGVSRIPAVLSYLQTSSSTLDSSGTVTISSQNFGAAAVDRYIFCGLTWSSDGDGYTLDSATIGGVSATIHVQNEDGVAIGYGSAIISAPVPSGTSGDIVLTFNQASISVRAHAYRVTGLSSQTEFDTDTDDDDIVSMSLNIPFGGFTLGCASFSSTNAITTTGLTEDFDTSGEVSGSSSDLAIETGRTISFNGGTGDAAGACASFR